MHIRSYYAHCFSVLRLLAVHLFAMVLPRLLFFLLFYIPYSLGREGGTAGRCG